ncbi:MAG: anti-sigma factor domain-containing protein [Peptostreptococcaceae bacterium]|nr:anti-sigma factor domain-containing protein [Peptostreptococcaceae bacterium]
MKGIVMEVDGKDLVVMKKNGEFIKMKKESQSARVGQEISVRSEKAGRKGTARRLTALAASFLLFFGAGAGGYAYYAPKGYVDVDINPGIELDYNMFDKVIRVTGVNGDGEDVLETAGNLKNKGVGTAVKMILEAAEEKEFIKDGSENFVNLLVSGRNKSENLEKAKNAIKNYHAETGLQFTYTAETGTMEKYKAFKAEAAGLEITPGKLNLLKKVYGENEETERNRNGDTEPLGIKPFADFAKGNKDLSVKEIMQTFNRGNGNGTLKDKGNEEDETGDVIDSNDETGNEESGNPGKGNSSGKGNK